MSGILDKIKSILGSPDDKKKDEKSHNSLLSDIEDKPSYLKMGENVALKGNTPKSMTPEEAEKHKRKQQNPKIW